jgi:hypothetical protein
MIHFTKNTSSNLRTYSTNFEKSKDYNTILTHFTNLQPTFYTNIDVHPLKMTHKQGRNTSRLFVGIFLNFNNFCTDMNAKKELRLSPSAAAAAAAAAAELCHSRLVPSAWVWVFPPSK